MINNERDNEECYNEENTIARRDGKTRSQEEEAKKKMRHREEEEEEPSYEVSEKTGVICRTSR